MSPRGLASLWLGCLGFFSPAQAGPPPIETLGAEAVGPGQKAVVRTVFEGTRVEEFGAEIVGVLRGGRTQGDMILARATSGRVLASGVALGMSGSPVYVDGKLVGALSSGWPFSREPLFGITPIGEMLEVLDHPSRGSADSTAGPSGIELAGASTDLGFREFRWSDDETELGRGHGTPTSGEWIPAFGLPSAADPRGAAAGMRLSRLALPVACTGLGPGALELARAWLEPFGLAAIPGGTSAPPGAEPPALEPGSAVAIELLRGDLQISAIGTVTYRDRDRVLLFGHPMFQSGEVRLPLAAAEIVTIVPSQVASFKLGVQGRAVGVAEQDRRAGVAGRLGGSPRMLPVSLSVEGTHPRPQDYRFESIEDRALAPTLIAIAGMNGVLESGGAATNQTLRWTMRLYRRGSAPLTLSDVTAGESPATQLAQGLHAPLRFLYGNPYGRLDLDSVSVTVRVEPGQAQWSLRSARVLDPAVRPGGRVRIEAEIERWRGGRETRRLTLRIPEEAPDGRYVVWVGGAADLSQYEARRLPGRYRPTSLDEAWRRLSEARDSRGLYAAAFGSAPEVTRAGRDYPELPLSALAILTSGQAGDGARGGHLATLDETHEPLEGPVRGALSLVLEVDSEAP